MGERLKREFNKIFLILENEEEDYQESYELEMIARNDLQTILPLRILRVDGKLQLHYEVSSRQTIKTCTERVKLSEESIRKLFQSIEDLTAEVRDYLLNMESVMFDLDHIYTKEGKFYFCYCPWKKQDPLCAMRKMLEEILGVLDYHDTKGVELAYHMYQSTCKGELSIAEILEEHEVKETKAETWEMSGEPLSFETEDLYDQETPKSETSGKSTVFSKILRFFLKKEKKKTIEKENGWEEAETLYRETFYEDPQDSFRETDSPTICLEQIPGGTWRLHPLTEGLPEFVLREAHFLVGKKKELVDGWIGKDTISRVHSRFDIREGHLYVTDANSTNGTFVNGVAVEPGQEIEIFVGDRILFADVGYECYNSL